MQRNYVVVIESTWRRKLFGAVLAAFLLAGASHSPAFASSRPGAKGQPNQAGSHSRATCSSDGNHYVGMARTSDGQGYWLVRSRGQVSSFGDAPVFPPPPHLAAPVVSIAAVGGSAGYLLLEENGTVIPEGTTSLGAPSLGSACDATAIATTPDGRGYWILLSSGGIFSFGDAGFYGSTDGSAGTTLVGLTPTPDGKGYWLLGADGLIDAFGDAVAYCNLDQINPNAFTVAGMAGTPDGGGFWVVGTTPQDNGGIFACGDAEYLGAPNPAPTAAFVAIASTPSGMGYWLLDDRGQVFPYGNALPAPFVGSN